MLLMAQYASGCDYKGMICGKFDACRPALGRVEQHDSTAARGVKDGADVLRSRIDAAVGR
jgi:hypothetical protein